jgi:hypothetical protein
MTAAHSMCIGKVLAVPELRRISNRNGVRRAKVGPMNDVATHCTRQCNLRQTNVVSQSIADSGSLTSPVDQFSARGSQLAN